MAENLDGKARNGANKMNVRASGAARVYKHTFTDRLKIGMTGNKTK